MLATGMGAFRAAVIQMNCVFQHREKNLARAEALLREAASAGAKVAVLPEMFGTGYSLYKDALLFAETPDGKLMTFLRTMAAELDLLIAGSYVEQQEHFLQSALTLVGPKGALATHRKIHLWKKERFYFVPGNTPTTVTTPLGTFGLLLSYDAGFPEQVRALAKAGSWALLTACAITEGHAYDVAMRARALENGLYNLVANRTGREQPMGRRFEIDFCGNSRIIAPDGTVIAQVGEGKEGVAVAEIDQAIAQQQRERLPYLRDWEEHEKRMAGGGNTPPSL